MNIINCIGNTPIIELPSDFIEAKAKVFVKLEEYNYGGSVKSRVGLQMILDAEESGLINKKRKPEEIVLVEATGGNTGIGIAQICSLRGYKCVLAVPDNYSKIRVKVLKDLGAEVVLSDSKTGNDSHIRQKDELLRENPDWICLDQFSNPSNPKAHYIGTGQELIHSLGSVDCFVSGIGSGGTITGTGRALKENNPKCKVFGVQPEGCDVRNGKAIPHKIQGIAIGQIPGVLDSEMIDDIYDVSFSDVLYWKEKLSHELGLYVGYSSVANIAIAINIARTNKYSVIATVAPDSGRNYLE